MKHVKKITEKTVRKWIKEGRGQGKGLGYRPLFRIGDVSSPGRKRRVPGLITGRTHHYLSDLEYRWHLWSEYQEGVVDIREQFALLPRELTLGIAARHGIRHSVYRGTSTPIIMSSDIVLTSRKGRVETNQVLCVKPRSKVARDVCRTSEETRVFNRTMEKLEIEREYWKSRGIRWRIVTEEDLPTKLVDNLAWLRAGFMGKELDTLNDHMLFFIDAFGWNWAPGITLNELLSRISSSIGLDVNHCHKLFGRAVWSKLIPVDIESAVIGHIYPVRLLKGAEVRCVRRVSAG